MAVVTGGSDGIGLAVSQLLVKSGLRVIIVHRSAAKAAFALCHSGADLGFVCDLATPQGIQNLLIELESRGLRTIDVLVNNAGKRLDPLPTEADLVDHARRAEDLLRTNFLSAFLLITALEEQMRAPGGRVINITSRAAYIGGEPIYVASKVALASLQLSLLERLGRRGITINSVAPGFIPDTGMFRGRLRKKRVDGEIDRTPVGQVGSVHDIARAVAFLASEDSAYITGQTLRVDGGVTTGA